jgi:hypothetical protein
MPPSTSNELVIPVPSKAVLAIQAKPSIPRLWRRSQRREGRNGRISRAVESACILLCATFAYLLLCELGVRLAIHAPLFEIHDFRHERAAKTINHAVEYDSLLGWRLKSFITSPGFNTLQYGFRSNDGPNVEVRQGGVLAVGSSFTAGSEVNDEQSWPAHLEQITGWNVNNAGSGNYVADQIMMHGEQLLPLIHPQVLVVDLIPDNIVGASYSSYGWPKPYFTVENDALVQHNEPVPTVRDPGRDRFGIKPFLGHLAIADQFMTAFFANSWFSSDGSSYITTHNDVVDVTCRLLDRLKQETDADNVRLVLYLQFAGSHVISTPHEAEQSVGVSKCARNLHIATVDEFATLREIYEKNPDDLREYYHIEPNGATGHKSSFGNLQAARSLEPVIRSFGAAIDQKSK